MAGTAAGAPQGRVATRGRPLQNESHTLGAALRRRFALPPTDLLRDAVYRRLWSSILIASIGGQVTMLALPLTAALLLNATPTQMGWLTALEILPFVLFSLPSGVWLDRVRKLPIYIAGEVSIGLAVASVPVAWWLGVLSMGWLYVVGFILGTVNTTAGSASQIVLTQVVPRERLVEAHAKNALANSSAEVVGPGLAGALIKLVGAPVALLLDAAMLLTSAVILRGVKVHEVREPHPDPNFWRDLKEGVRFVRSQRLLVALAAAVGGWQMCHNGALVVQILHATRDLRLSENAIGLCYVGLGLGTISASVLGHRISHRLGSGPTLVLGFATCGIGWLLPALAGLAGATRPVSILAFALMLVCFGVGAVLVFINFLALRQAVTPEPLLGRMTSTMRWLILIPAGPGALLGGWIGEHVGLRATLGYAGVAALVVAALAWRRPEIRLTRKLPTPQPQPA
jgi:MFS family permease